MRQVSVSSSSNGRNSSRPTSAAQRQPSSAVVEMHDSDFASSSSEEEDSVSDRKPFVVNTAKGTVTGGMLGGDDSSSSSSSDESSSDSSTDEEEEGSNRRQQPLPPKQQSLQQRQQQQQQQQQTFMPSSSSSSSKSSSAATSPTSSRQIPPMQQQQQTQQPVSPAASSRAAEPNFNSFNRPGFNRLESEFTYGDPVEEKAARLSIQPTPPQSRPSNQITSPRANGVAATNGSPVPAASSPKFTASAATAVPAFIVADDVALNLPPLDSFDSGTSDTCELCDENQARVYCVECNMRFCWGSSVATGAIEGCVLDMHRNEERRTHQRYEWTDKGQGKFIQFEANTPIPATAPVIRSNASSRQSSRPPSAAHSHVASKPHQQQHQQPPIQAKKLISRSSSSTASVAEEEFSQQPLKQVTESPAHLRSSQSPSLPYLPIPPQITEYTSAIPDMCDLCDEHEARVYCEECDMKLCWGTSDNSNGSYNSSSSSSSSSSAPQHIIGCVVDMHRNAEVLSHHRYEWKDGARGMLLPFQEQLPETPKAEINRTRSVTQQQYEEAREKTELLRQQSSQLVTELAEHDRPHEPQPIYEAPVYESPEPAFNPEPTYSHSASSSSSSSSFQGPSIVPPNSSSSRPTSAARSQPSRPSTATLRSLAPADAALLDAVTSDPASWSSLQVCNWLTTLSPSYFSLHGIFLSMGVTGTMLLNLTDGQLQEELHVQDFNIRKKILDGIQILKVKSRSVVGSISSVALVSANGRPFPTELHQAAQATLEARGFQVNEDDDMAFGEAQSPQSNAVPYTRAQLMFMLGERNRLIAHLTSENEELKQKIIELSSGQ